MTVEIGRTRLRLRFTFVLLVTLMLILCEEKVVLMSFFASCLHETGHLVLMLFSGDRINYVELGIFGMRIERQGTLICYKKEALCAMGGIAANVLAAMFSAVLYISTEKVGFILFSIVNIFVAAVNMVPVRILDFGRFLHLMMCEKRGVEKADEIIRRVSFVFALILNAICVIYCIVIGPNISFITVTVYLDIITFKKKWS